MDTPQSALAQYREATKHLPKLSERQQILNLKFELFHALQRGNEFQDRSRALESRVAELEAPASDREAMLDALAKKLKVDLDEKTWELTVARADHAKDVRRMRLELRASEIQIELLDERCRDLVARAARRAAAPSGVPHQPPPNLAPRARHARR